MERIAHDELVYAAAGSEPAQDPTRPGTIAARTDTGWIVTGCKVFCTMSAAADVLYTTVTFVGAEGGECYGDALVPRDAPGVVVHDDWDALGMRSSASHTVSFDEVHLPESALRGGFRAGDAVSFMERTLNAGLFHAAAALGVAEAADAAARVPLGRRAQLDPRSVTLAAENVVDLSAARAVFSRAAELIDEQHERTPSRSRRTSS